MAFHDEDEVPSQLSRGSRELTAIANFLYDQDEATLDEVVAATQLEVAVVAKHLAGLRSRGELVVLEDGRYGWLG